MTRAALERIKELTRNADSADWMTLINDAVEVYTIADAALASQEAAPPVAYCEPDNPLNHQAFAWPGNEREARHSMPLYTRPADWNAAVEAAAMDYVKERLSLYWAESDEDYSAEAFTLDISKPLKLGPYALGYKP